MKKIKFCALAITVSALLFSCKKNDSPVVNPPKVTTGLFVLNEGGFGHNNTTLSFYNFATSTPTTDFFAAANGSGLGDTGNDILIYGGKIYIVMNVSSYVEVADATTAKEIKKISFSPTGGSPQEPRSVVAYKNKILVSAYDGTVSVIDTSSLVVEKAIKVGTNPEQMAVYGTNLYVANSGGLNLSGIPDSTVSVVDLGTFTETKKITVGSNPVDMTADDAGNIYIGCLGDYGAITPRLVKISASSGTVVKSADTAVGKMKYYNGLLYATGGYLGSSFVRTLSTTDFKQSSANFVTDGTVIASPYGINIDETNGDVYVTDAKDYASAGAVFCFDKTGKKKFSFSVAPGISPNTVAIIKK